MRLRLLLATVGAACVLGAFHYAPTFAQETLGFYIVEVNWTLDLTSPGHTDNFWYHSQQIFERPEYGNAAIVGMFVDTTVTGGEFSNIYYSNSTDYADPPRRIAINNGFLPDYHANYTGDTVCSTIHFTIQSDGTQVCDLFGLTYNRRYNSSTSEAYGTKFLNDTYTQNELSSANNATRYIQPHLQDAGSDGWQTSGVITITHLIYFGDQPIEDWYTPFTETDEHHLWENQLITETALYHPPPVEGWGDMTVHSTSETEDALVHAAVGGRVVSIVPLDVDDCPPEGYQGTTCDVTVLDTDGTPRNDSIIAVGDWSAGAVITIDPDTTSYPDDTRLQYIVKNPYVYTESGTDIEAGCVLGEALRVQYDRIAQKPLYRYYTAAQLIDPSPAEGQTGRYDLAQHLTTRPPTSNPCSAQDDTCYNANPYLTNLDDWQLNTGGNLFSGYAPTERAVSLEPGASITQLIDGLEANYYYTLSVFAVGTGTLDVSLLDGTGSIRFESDTTPVYNSTQLVSTQAGVMHPLRIEASDENADSLLIYYVCLAPGEQDVLGSACYFVNPSFTDGGFGWNYGGDIGFNNSIAEFGPSAFISQNTLLNTADDGSVFEYEIDLYFGEQVNYSNIAGADGDMVLSMTYNEVQDEIARIDVPQIEFEDLGTDRAKRTITYTVDRYSGGNVLANGNFESDDLSMWTDNNNNATYSVTNGELVANRASGSNEVQIQQELSLDNWSTGEQIEITADISKAGAAAKTAGFRMIGYREPNDIEQNTFCEFSITDTPQRYTQILTASGDWDGGRFRLTIDDTDTTTDVIFDNVVVRSVNNSGAADGCYGPGDNVPTAPADSNRLFTLESNYSLTDPATETYIAIDRVCITPITADTFPGYDNSVIEQIGDGGLDDDGNVSACKAFIQRPTSTVLNPQLWAWFQWIWENIYNSFVCLFVPAYEILIDLTTELTGILLSFFRYIGTLTILATAFLINALQVIWGYLANLVNHPAVGQIIDLLASAGRFIVAAAAFVGRAIGTIINFITTAVNLIIFAFTSWGDVVNAWRVATPLPTPGIPDCAVETGNGLCLSIWIMDNTVMADNRLFSVLILLVAASGLMLIVWSLQTTYKVIGQYTRT